MKKLTLALLIAALLALPMSALALEKMSGADLGGVVGQAGVTIAFGSTTTTTISFSQIAWGDPDGYGTCSDSAGWIILDGNIVIESVMSCGEQLVLDIATNASGGTCTNGCVEIPNGITFIAVGLPTTTLSIGVPDTLAIGLGSTSAAITGTLGLLNLRNLSVNAGTPTTLFIWAH